MKNDIISAKVTTYEMWCWNCDRVFTTEEKVTEVKFVKFPHCGGELDMSDVEIESNE